MDISKRGEEKLHSLLSTNGVPWKALREKQPKPGVLSLSGEFSFSLGFPVFCLEGQHLPSSKKHESQALRPAHREVSVPLADRSAVPFALFKNSPLGLFKGETIQQERQLHRGGLQTLPWLPCFPPHPPTLPASEIWGCSKWQEG